MNLSKPATDSYGNLLENMSRRRESWRHALFQSIIESGWFWLGVGITLFGLAMWVWG